MKKLLFPVLLLGIFANAQVGVNTDAPNATFDVVGNAADTNKFDGIIAPRILGDQLKLKNYTSSQTGALVYVTTADTSPSGQTVDVTSSGYYYFNGDLDKWIKITSGNLLEPWQVQGTNTASTQNTENIYQQGKVAIGTTSSSAVSTKQLDVAGDFKSKYTDGTNYYGIETNSSDFGVPVNVIYSANNNDLTAATQSSLLSIQNGTSNLQSNNGLGGSSVAAFSNSGGGNVGMTAINSDASVTSSIWGYNDGSKSNLSLSHTKTNGESASVTIEKTKGVTFSFSDSSGNAQGAYDFPKTNGSANQVLVTDGSGSIANLSWKDASAFNLKIRTMASGTVLADDYTILISGNISLPAASASNLGKVYNLINDTNGNVTVNGTLRFNGGNISNYGFNNSDLGRGIVVQSTGSAWVIISRY
ncbi:hypothetical protein QFZ37_001306 [Chryseobacterium ginsenosidimutans]|uniref:hypothetical protein n=1 Tax=Chryseobacterium ginsenosidimutans TaxID=687846 RepID=UPI00278075AA|nr:hypothetical protein [Chryseobacterium ginsenosidimutans]MDQ0592937.1 hypothetical protein [Chryseobacterium ginsenosidimutans]